MALLFWGRKSKEYMEEILKLYPEDEVHTIVDACMGSGSFSRNISCQMDNVERIAFELDQSLCTLHQVIKNDAWGLIEKVLDSTFSDELYLHCRRITREYNVGNNNYSGLEIAFAELVILYFSYNSMRGNVPRRYDSYLKYDDEKKHNEVRGRLRHMIERFQLKAPSDIICLSERWQELEIVHDSFLNHTDLWENEKCWIYIDTPYELHKRGIDETKNWKCSYLGYDVDMTKEDHEQFISEVIKMSEECRLKAKMIICTNYEIDDKGNVIIPQNDLYSRLTEYGFKRVLVENKHSSKPHISTQEDGKVARQRRRKKVEAVYINYKTI